MLQNRIMLVSCAALTIITAFLFHGTAVAQDDKLATYRLKVQSEKIIKNILNGIKQGDYSVFSRDFSDEARRQQTREQFLAMQASIQKNLGKLKSMEYMGFYMRYPHVVALFKARFSKQKSDVLIKLALDRDELSPKVTGIWLE